MPQDCLKPVGAALLAGLLTTSAPAFAESPTNGAATPGYAGMVAADSVDRLLDDLAPLMGAIVSDGWQSGPPPWAPVQGYRQQELAQGFALSDLLDVSGDGTGSCNTELIGKIVGGAIGGFAGNSFSDGGILGTVATVAGAAIGARIGSTVARTIDRTCLGQTLEQVPDGETIVWDTPQLPRQTVTLRDTEQTEDGTWCRTFQRSSGRESDTGRACRDESGNWLVRS